MDATRLASLLREVASGTLSPEEAAERLARLPMLAASEDLLVDTHRELRTGIAEAIYCPGKTVTHVLDAARVLLEAPGGAVLATRAEPEHLDALSQTYPGTLIDPVGRVATLRSYDGAPIGRVAVVTAGTTDLPVAREAVACLEAFGAKTELYIDRGVAGLHRMLAVAEGLRDTDVVIVCAGMEGALPSVVGGIVSAPVIAVPTSTGYGAAFGGITALLAMLSSCTPGIGVVGIDNGFGAAALAARILGSREA